MIANANWTRMTEAWPRLDLRARELLAGIAEALVGVEGPKPQAAEALTGSAKALSALGAEGPDNADTQ